MCTQLLYKQIGCTTDRRSAARFTHHYATGCCCVQACLCNPASNAEDFKSWVAFTLVFRLLSTMLSSPCRLYLEGQPCPPADVHKARQEPSTAVLPFIAVSNSSHAHAASQTTLLQAVHTTAICQRRSIIPYIPGLRKQDCSHHGCQEIIRCKGVWDRPRMA